MPRLGNFLKTEKGDTGIIFRAYNEPPSVKNREVADEIHLLNTELLMMDYDCPKLKEKLWYADIEGWLLMLLWETKTDEQVILMPMRIANSSSDWVSMVPPSSLSMTN